MEKATEWSAGGVMGDGEGTEKRLCLKRRSAGNRDGCGWQSLWYNRSVRPLWLLETPNVEITNNKTLPN